MLFRFFLNVVCKLFSSGFVCAVLMLGAAPGVQAQAGHDRVILVVGDSLSAEYGLARGSGWVVVLQDRLRPEFPQLVWRNASISGDTTSGGVSRLPQALAQHQPDVVILELGANDALRGLSLQGTRSNLARMLELSHAAGARVVLVGMQIPPNYGRTYTEAFHALFADLAQEYGAERVPFLLDGMATDRTLFQADGIHPNEAAQPLLADNVERALRPLLRDAHQP